VCESKFGEGKKDRMRECVKVNLERKKKQDESVWRGKKKQDESVCESKFGEEKKKDERVCESKFGEEKKTG
jgi:hypothetical protein